MNLFNLLAIITTLPLIAAVDIELNPKTAPEVVLSTVSPNRIVFEQGDITGVHFDQDCFQAVLNEKTGEAFVTPKRENKTPSAITLTTSTGKSQTLNVVAKEVPGEIITIHNPKEIRREEPTAPIPLTTDYHSRTIQLLHDLLSYRTPKGYGVKELSYAKPFPLTLPLESTPLYFFEGPFDTLLLLSVENKSKVDIAIDAETLKSTEERWIFCPNRYIRPKQRALLIVCREKKEARHD